MPRFEREGFTNSNNDNRDRTVPQNENYYKNASDDFDIVSDNQLYNDNSTGLYDGMDYNSNGSNSPNQFVSERYTDFNSATPRKKNQNGSGKQKNTKKRRRGKKLSAGKKILIIILVILLIIALLATPILARVNYDSQVDNEYVTSSELEDSIFVKNILLIGVDARSSDDDESSRSDTMMLISVDMLHHCIKLTSFLRDTWVYIPCEDTNQRLNAACTYGGYSGVVDTIEYNFGIEIDNYVVTDFEMFQTMVDSLGGVEIEVSEAEANEINNHPSRYGDVTIESGTSTLTGEQALAYCRIRKIDSDFQRTERQRTVMSAILSTALHSNPISLYKMAYNSAPYIETDMTKGQLIRFVAAAAFCATGNIYQQSVPFDGTWSYATISGNSVISIDLEENKAQLIDYIYNQSSKDLEAAESDDSE